MLSKIFIQRPRLAIVISLTIILAGLICLLQIPIAEYPKIAPPSIKIRATYPGASSQVIIDTVAAPIESQINGVEDMIYFSSKSDNSGSYELTATFKPGADADLAQVNVQNRLSQATPSLPTEVNNIGVKVTKQSSDMLGLYNFITTDDSIDDLYLSNYISRNVKDEIARIDGISAVTIFGEKPYSMRVWLDPDRLASMGITPQEVQSALRSQNIQAAAGAIGSEKSSAYTQYKINAQGRLNSVEDFKSIIIRNGENGAQVHLSDIARVELGSAMNSGINFFNGKVSIPMAIYRNSDANAIEVVTAVNKKLTELKQGFPKGIDYVMGYDPTEFIKITLTEIAYTLLSTIILVVLITYVFLQDIRATIIPAVTIPVSLIGTFIILKALNFSANTLTLFALVLAIGLVVDDAIVVVENVIRNIQEKKLPPKEATMQAMQEVTGAVLATTLVLLAVFCANRLLRRHYRHNLQTVCGHYLYCTGTFNSQCSNSESSFVRNSTQTARQQTVQMACAF